MLNLLLAVLCSSLVSIVMRLGSAGGEQRRSMLMVNYIACTVVSLLFVWNGWGLQKPELSVSLGLGVLGGALYLGAFLLLQLSVNRNGVSVSSAFMKLGVIVPTLLGYAFFGEHANAARLAGIVLTVLAIAVLAGWLPPHKNRTDIQHSAHVPLLIMLMLTGGMADGLSKFHQVWGNPSLEGIFLLCIFAVALVLCALLCAVHRQWPDKRDWGLGLLLGIPNYFSSRFLLLALQRVPAIVAFPAFSSGTLLLTTTAARLLFGEKLDVRQIAALIMVTAALILLNV